MKKRKACMKISIVIPTYNREHLLKETINAMLKQTFQNFEIVIVDNCSVDNTEQMIQAFNDSRIRYFKNQNNGIFAINRNLGIRQTTGEFIAFSDDDDIWLPDKLEKQLLEFEKDENIGLVCTNGVLYYQNQDGKKIGKSSDRYISFKKLLKNNVIICSSAMVKKSVLNEVGVFIENRDFVAGEDYELWLRIAKKFKVRYIGAPLVKYRIHQAAYQNIFLVGEKTLTLNDRIYQNLLKENLIDKRVYKNLIQNLNYKKVFSLIVNHDASLSLELINKTEIDFWKKCKLLLMFFSDNVKVLNIFRRMNQSFS